MLQTPPRQQMAAGPSAGLIFAPPFALLLQNPVPKQQMSSWFKCAPCGVVSGVSLDPRNIATYPVADYSLPNATTKPTKTPTTTTANATTNATTVTAAAATTNNNNATTAAAAPAPSTAAAAPSAAPVAAPASAPASDATSAEDTAQPEWSEWPYKSDVPALPNTATAAAATATTNGSTTAAAGSGGGGLGTAAIAGIAAGAAVLLAVAASIAIHQMRKRKGRTAADSLPAASAGAQATVSLLSGTVAPKLTTMA